MDWNHLVQNVRVPDDDEERLAPCDSHVEPLLVFEEADLGDLIDLDVVRVAPDGAENDDAPLLSLELLGGPHGDVRVAQLHPDLLTLSPEMRVYHHSTVVTRRQNCTCKER